MTAILPYVPLPLDRSDVRYAHGPDSVVRSEVTSGQLTEFTLEDSALYPGTSRRFWVHEPSGLDRSLPAGVLVILDGGLYLDPRGEVRGATVLDNLHHRGEIPPTISVFLDPGVHRDPAAPKQRNVEFDAPGDTFAQFLLDEVLPLVEERWRITDDPERRAVCGGSSGGNAAFTAAWHRPDRFRRVIAFLPSFAQMAGGNPYPALLAAGERRPLRTFLQIGQRDLGFDRSHHNWLATNLRMLAALAETGHDVRGVLGEGGHSPNHGGVLFPDALRWVLAP